MTAVEIVWSRIPCNLYLSDRLGVKKENNKATLVDWQYDKSLASLSTPSFFLDGTFPSRVRLSI